MASWEQTDFLEENPVVCDRALTREVVTFFYLFIFYLVSHKYFSVVLKWNVPDEILMIGSQGVGPHLSLSPLYLK